MEISERLKKVLRGKSWEEVFSEHVILGGWCIFHDETKSQVIRKDWNRFTWNCGSLTGNVCNHTKEDLIEFLTSLDPVTQNEFGEITP